MKIRSKMIKKNDLILVDVNETINEAIKKLESGDFLSLPVVSGDEFRGVIFSDDIYKKYFKNKNITKEEFLKNTCVSDVYVPKTEFVSENQELEEGTLLLLKNKKTFLPVFENDKFVGILTHSAIFEHFFNILGSNNENRISVIIYNMKGQLASLINSSKGLDVNILSLIIEDVKVMSYYRVIMTIEGKDLGEFKERIEKNFRID